MREKRPRWILKTHFFRRDEYICSDCGFSADNPYVKCPNCKSPMSATKYKASWVDDIEEIDSLFGD